MRLINFEGMSFKYLNRCTCGRMFSRMPSADNITQTVCSKCYELPNKCKCEKIAQYTH